MKKGGLFIISVFAGIFLLVLVLTFQPVPEDENINFVDLANIVTQSPTNFTTNLFITNVKNSVEVSDIGIESISGGDPTGQITLSPVHSELNNVDFARFCYWLGKSQMGYVYGAQGELCTRELCDNANRKYGKIAQGDISYQKWNGRISFDCSGVLRGYSRFDFLSKTFTATYRHSYSDATNIYNQSKELQHGDISTIPNIPGLGLIVNPDSNGEYVHIGYYLGNGLVMDANSSAIGCQIRKIGSAPEFKTWFYISGLTYYK